MSQPSPPPGSVPPGSGPPPPGYGPPPPPGYGPPPPGYGPPAYGGRPFEHKPGVVALRPLGLGDIFDGAFRTIRRNPGSMVGLAALVSTAFLAVPVVLTLALAALGELSSPVDPGTLGSGDPAALDLGGAQLLGYLGSVFGLFATVVLNGMLVHVVAEAVLGRRTSIGQAWAATRGKMWRLVGLMLLSLVVLVVLAGVPVAVGFWVGTSAGVGWGFLTGGVGVVLGLVAFLYVQVRYFQLAAPALVLEDLGVGAAVGRGGRLTRGRFWPILGVLLLASLVAGLVGQVLSLPLQLLGFAGIFLAPGTGGTLLMVFSTYLSQVLVGAVTTPFVSGVAALQYVDQRIRSEGLDVQLIAASQRDPR